MSDEPRKKWWTYLVNAFVDEIVMRLLFALLVGGGALWVYLASR